MKKNPIHIVFSGGGTGGHLFPGLAVAERLMTMIPNLRITFCGIGKSFERKHVAQAGYDYFTLPSCPLPRGPREAVAFVVENLAGYLAAKRFLIEENVAGVVGLGGYTSVPMARAAAKKKLPLVLLEQNAIPGKATRWLARWASLICTAFEPASLKSYGQCPIRRTGNPIHRAFAQDWKSFLLQETTTSATNEVFSFSRGKTHSTKQLLVLGGSNGARSLNENVPPALYKVRSQLQGWRIVHQCGESGVEPTKILYKKLGFEATVAPFLNDMPRIYAETDLAVCRAGGTTLAELAAAGTPAVLLPYPEAADDHQLANARYYSAGGGCVTIDERKIPGRWDDELAEKLCFLLANDGLRQLMSAAMLDMARPNAAEDVAELIWSIVSSRSCQSELMAA